MCEVPHVLHGGDQRFGMYMADNIIPKLFVKPCKHSNWVITKRLQWQTNAGQHGCYALSAYKTLNNLGN